LHKDFFQIKINT